MSRGIGILMIPVYTRLLTPKDYGIIEILTISGAILAIFLNVEVHQAVARFYPDAPTSDQKKLIVSTALLFIVSSYVVFNLIALFVLKQISEILLEDSIYSQLVLYAIWAFTLNAVFNFLQNQLAWQLKSKYNAYSAVTYTVLTAILTVFFLKYFKMGVSSVFLAQVIAALVGITMSFRFAQSSYGFEFDMPALKSLLKFSMPLVPATLTVYGMLYVDRYIINHYLSLNEVGLYSVAYKFASVLGLMTTGVQTALTPLIYTYYMEKDTPYRIATLFRYFCIVVLLIMTIVSVFSREFLMILTNESYYNASSLIPFLLVSFFFTSIINFTPGIFIRKRTMLIVYINIATFMLNLIGNLVFVKIYGAIGSAFATMLSSISYFVIYYLIGNRLYPVPHSNSNLILSFFCAAIFVSIVYLIQPCPLWTKFVLCSISSVITILLLLKKSDFIHIHNFVRGRLI